MSDRFTRQADLVPRDKIADVKATIIGVGAIGRQVALQLGAIGVPKIQLIDFDRVDESNITTQGYRADQINHRKVGATADDLAELTGDYEAEEVFDRYRPTMETGQAVFCCVDSITARGAIWDGLHDREDNLVPDFWADGRMLGEVMRIFSVHKGDDRAGNYYANSLFVESETEPGRCTARSTIYCASIAAGLMVHQFTRWLRGLPCDKEISLNLLASEMIVT